MSRGIDELLAGCADRRPMTSGDSKSGNEFERVRVGGDECVVKHLRLDDDWLMRAAGDLGPTEVQVWSAGLLDVLPQGVGHAVLGASRPEVGAAALLLRDIGPWLVPEGDDPVPLEQHLGFVDHMAALHACFWGWRDTVGLTPLGNRYLLFSPAVVEAERERGSGAVVPGVMGRGWPLLPGASPAAAAVVLPLLDDPTPLLAALADGPQTLVHGDWKMGNLATGPDGATVLIDWAYAGEAPACADLAWYLALNAARLPQTKEASIDAYRVALEAHGVDTAGWWDAQLALCLLGAMVQFGWEKALGGDGPELRWWTDRALEGARYLS